MLHVENDLNELLITKEQELKELQARQIHFQKTALQESQKRLRETHRKFNKLKEDFTYNLRVLEERDKELEHYDSLFTQLKMLENAKKAEVSDLRILVDKLQQKLAQEIKKQEAQQYQYQQKLKEHQLELEQFHRSKDLDINHHREEYENMKRQLERKLLEVEGELALQRQELLVEFDAELKKREHEFRRKADEMSNLVLSHELKVKLLSKELEALKEAGMKASESLKMAETTNLELEKEVKCKIWEIKDLTAMKDAQIRDLESKLDLVQLSWKKEKETFERKYATVDRFAKEKDAILASVKEAHAEQIHKWEYQVRELQINKETLEMELHRAELRHSDCLREKDIIIEKLKQELEGQKTNWASQVAQISRETAAKDLQIQGLQEEEVKLRAQVASLLQDVVRYKQQLSLATEKEETQKRAKVQTELDWRRRCEDAERNQYQQSEALIQSLSTARDQVTAELKEKEQKLHEAEVILSAVILERDQAVQELQKHGLLPKGIKQVAHVVPDNYVLPKKLENVYTQEGKPTEQLFCKENSLVTLEDNVGTNELGFPSADIQRLQEQNSTLRAVIAEMRKQMETLNIQATFSDDTKRKIQDTDGTNIAAVSFTLDYVQSLEAEIKSLKKKCWAMNKQHEIETEVPGKLFVSSLNPSSCNKSTQTYHEGYIFNGNNGASQPHEFVIEPSSKKPEVRVPQADSNPLTKWLQEDSVHLRQHLFGLGAGDGRYHYTRSHAKMMQSKLKEAVRKICSLSKEKQQLLEMVNRLRAELGAVSKEVFQDFKTSKQSQEHGGFPGALCPMEFARETKHRLLALEHLQYQLTTQELQYAQRKHASGKCPQFVESLCNETVPSSSSCDEEAAGSLKLQVPLEAFVGNYTADLQNHETLVSCEHQAPRKESPSQSQQGQLSSSDVYSSLQDIWQILEMGSSPSVLSPQSGNIQEKSQVIHEAERLEDSQKKGQADYLEEKPTTALTVQGTKFDIQSKLKPSKSSYNQIRKPRTSQRITKIRNYNVKD